MSTSPAAPAASPGSRDRSGGIRGWWRNGVIYQVYVPSFQDSDGDGIGDLGGVQARPHTLRKTVATTLDAAAGTDLPA